MRWLWLVAGALLLPMVAFAAEPPTPPEVDCTAVVGYWRNAANRAMDELGVAQGRVVSLEQQVKALQAQAAEAKKAAEPAAPAASKPAQK